MDREMENLKSHNVYELVPRRNSNAPSNLDGYPTGSSKNGLFDRNKGRLVGQGSHQCPSIDYGESFSPVMGLESLHTILALAAIRDLGVIQLDITSAYLHGTLKEEVYMEQPDGYVAPGKEDWVSALRRAYTG